jgi:4-diphosphocytidyl-2-C-methyl-D-erythritol kinase
LMGAVTIAACAKVNLHLRVLGRRSDGYHELETVFQSISLADELTFQDAPDGVAVDMSVPPQGPEAPPANENLIDKAARAVARRAGVARGVTVSVDKRIPLGAGLGGGSADAAATLVALNELWELGLSQYELTQIGLALGSDVPFCLMGGRAVGTSRGERLRALPAGGELWFVLGISSEPLSTADVYAAWDVLPRDSGAPPAPPSLGPDRGDAVGPLLHNDLERAALVLRPKLADDKRALLEAGALGALVAGSGPTIFGLGRDEAHAAALAAAVSPRFDRVEVTSSSPRGLVRAPAGGDLHPPGG